MGEYRLCGSPICRYKTNRTQLPLASSPTTNLFSASDLLNSSCIPLFIQGCRGRWGGLVTEQACAGKGGLLWCYICPEWVPFENMMKGSIRPSGGDFHSAMKVNIYYAQVF